MIYIAKKVLSLLPDKAYIWLQYYHHTGRRLNLKNPQRYNEKLQWIKLYDHNPAYTDMVDKYKVKQLITDKIGAQYVIPLLGVWDNAEEIDFDSLPDRFVLKTNHDSKGVVICKNKRALATEEVKAFLNNRLKHDGYKYGREWPYKSIQRKIIAEQYVEDSNGELHDYKVMCFNGIPKLIQLHRGRFSNHHTQEFYNNNWERQAFNQKGETMAETPIAPPSSLKEMLSLSAKLSEGIPHVRVDWYIVDGRLIFGELTFFDAAGYDEFVPDEMNEEIGSWINLDMLVTK